jgi:hypothetical protein
MPEDFGPFDEQREPLETIVRRLTAMVVQMDGYMQRQGELNEEQRTINARLAAAIERMDERQGRHEARMDVYVQNQDRINERLTAAIERIDQTLAQLLKRSTNGREA